ncbi:hypothetical protein PHYBLDRAFT_147611 [Phycomyces blakesleeanus NRRL 1555(-)]|uniref:DNA topoisomerase (ATP-hydrolyzing) n=1 Tax=Phycomyces blakesleeanus (strain ATCC 8743b / DSM 1359 / FGSC 10004 / NBRC 33097 / NRRL 1555) TaxID=763407 RepID=A0A163A4V9_PHYB8|nr:hypothetical protein PHYBLDRAFT_147611 [Phycomyces blakesleeanus NRRL 1555(-)]OAD71101.1 hypothetical protein PHYBLDRAFT_147611 [Phycomyces blakesleeanus NRRL 1555(-)]|eukprot:XP_018289141.1 hypothetical protein PHYBLDRAFT_147611 [Phycomyces blakesleeanus NRRL 1555(-)]
MNPFYYPWLGPVFPGGQLQGQELCHYNYVHNSNNNNNSSSSSSSSSNNININSNNIYSANEPICGSFNQEQINVDTNFEDLQYSTESSLMSLNINNWQASPNSLNSSAESSSLAILDHFEYNPPGYDIKPEVLDSQVVPEDSPSSQFSRSSNERPQRRYVPLSAGKNSKKRTLDDMNEEYSTQATDTQSTATMSSSSQLGSLGMPGSCNRRVGLFTEAQAKSVARYLRLLEIIYAAIASDTVITKRDIFYRDVTLFGGQNYIDRMVDNICYYFNTPRSSLHIASTASSKGLVCGPITITLKNGKRINCKYSKKSNSGHEDHQGCLVPSFSQITKIELNAKFVIVVEKEDISTRHIVKHISVNFTGIPIMALMDNDPHGLEIYSVYRWGSLSQAFDTANLAPLTKADRDKARGIITMREKFFGSPKGFWSDECPQRNSKSYKEFIKELCAILHINMKCELQGLCVAGGPFAMPRYVEKCLEKFKTS